jgi:hypothetical protein
MHIAAEKYKKTIRKIHPKERAPEKIFHIFEIRIRIEHNLFEIAIAAHESCNKTIYL